MLFKKGVRAFKKSVAKEAKLKKFEEKEEKYRIKKPHKKVILVGILIIVIVVLIELFYGTEFLQLDFSYLNKIYQDNVTLFSSSEWTIIITVLLAVVLILLFIITRFKKDSKKERYIESRVQEILDRENQFKKELEDLLKKSLELLKKHPEKGKLRKTSEQINNILRSPTKDYGEVKRILKIIDKLFTKLPKEEIKKFADSEDAEIYEKLIKKYKVK